MAPRTVRVSPFPIYEEMTGISGRYYFNTAHGPVETQFMQMGDTRLFIHTFVPVSERGRGYANTIIEAAKADTEAAGLKIIPMCSAWMHYLLDKKKGV